jgi:hypothetical protein
MHMGGRERERERARLRTRSDLSVFSFCGEARNGKSGET